MSGRFLILAGGVVLRGVMLVTSLSHAVAAQNAQPKPEAPKKMAADADPAYEVASIKLADPDSTSAGYHMQGRRLTIENKTLRQMFSFAYEAHPRQVIGELSQSATEHYDIEGVLDTDGDPNLKQMQSVVQKLLAERFALQFHRETQVLPVYVLTVALDGPKAARSQGDPNERGNENDEMHSGVVTQFVTNRSMSDFAFSVQYFLDRPVVDLTGLAGKWDFKWTWTSDESGLRPDAVDPPPGIFTAIQEQLGLKLEAKKAPCAVYVIDHAEGPSAN